jgi:DNA-3-methyladenine glycosylase I
LSAQGIPGPEPRRCDWAGTTPDYIAYHDDEWGRPVRDDRGLYERLTLEAFQSGLSWLTILRKREHFREAFRGFDPRVVSAFDESDVERLMRDPGIVRNRRKIDAAITNAGAIQDLEGSFAELLWSFVPAVPRPAPQTLADIAPTTTESAAMAKELKRRGFVFVGPTTCHALMQATGMVNDHLVYCWRR